jgi:hypothetical protein
MKDLLRLFTPPEWSWWETQDRLTYLVALVAFLGLMALGAWKLYELIA